MIHRIDCFQVLQPKWNIKQDFEERVVEGYGQDDPVNDGHSYELTDKLKELAVFGGVFAQSKMLSGSIWGFLLVFELPFVKRPRRGSKSCSVTSVKTLF